MPTEITESDMFVLLSNRRRRLALQILREFTTPLTPRELAEQIGKREYEDLSDEERRSVYISLYHNHLPRLEEADVVVYDPDEEKVQPSTNFDDLVHVLDGVKNWESSWSAE